MYISLMFAMLMISAVWTSIGTGDAILTKLRSQEAADSAAYSGAVAHAQGMNFIAMLNVSMLALTGVFITGHKMGDVLEAAYAPNLNTNNWHDRASSQRGDEASKYTGSVPVLGAEKYIVARTFGWPVGPGPLSSYSCIADHTCADRDVMGDCEHQQARKVVGDHNYCEISGRLEGSRNQLLYGNNTTREQWSMDAFEREVIGNGFANMAEMQSVIANNQGGLGMAVGAMAGGSMVGAKGSIDAADGTLPEDTKVYVASITAKAGAGGFFASSARAVNSAPSSTAVKFVGQLPMTPHAVRDLCGYLTGGVNATQLDLHNLVGSRPNASSKRQVETARYLGGAVIDTAMRNGARCEGDASIWARPDGAGFKGPMFMAGGAAGGINLEGTEIMNGGKAFQLVGMTSGTPDQARSNFVKGPFRWFGGIKAGAGKIAGEDSQGAGAVAAATQQRAESEFYLHCADGGSDGQWGDDKCNGQNLAGFRLQWRARLAPIRSEILAASGLGGSSGESSPAVDGRVMTGGSSPIKGRPKRN